MVDEFSHVYDKTAGDLGREALWFCLHTFFAVLVLSVAVAVIALTHPSIDDGNPKILCTVLAFVLPFAAGLVIAKARQDKVAGYVWISGLLTFCIVCVWVLDLPTGPGLCEKCGAVEKLYRTFFDIDHGSGLMAGDGLLVGTWIPLSMVGYAIGAKLGLD
jgi:hypothetical protein